MTNRSMSRNVYERHLERALMALYWARTAAEAGGLEGEAQDCADLRREVERLFADSANGKARPLRSLFS